ncbi:MAG: DUF748 domain-containing protein [Thermodesulfobacteriota bacterium]
MLERLRTVWRGLARPWRWLACAAGLALALHLSGFLLVPPLVRAQLESALSGALNRAARVERVRFNPLTLALTVEGLAVSEPDGSRTFLSCGRLFLDLDALSLPTLTLRASELRLDDPYARLVFTGNGTANFSDLLAGEGGGGGEPGAGVGLPVVLRSLAVSRGRFDVEDQALGKRHEVRGFTLDVPFASSLPADSAAYVEPTLAAEVNGRPVRLRGRTLPFDPSRRTEFDFGLEDADLAEYWAYAPVPAGLALTSGRLSCNGSVVLEQTGELLPQLFVRGRFALRDLALAGPGGGQMAVLDGLDLELSRFSLLERALDLGRVEARGLRADLTRREDGSLDWAGLVPAAGPGEPATTPGPPFVMRCAELVLEQGRVRFTDRAAPGGFSAALESIALRAANATTGPGRADFTLSARGGAELQARGSFSLEPLGLDATVSLAGLSLPSLAPYLAETLPVRVAAGAAGGSGRVQAGPGGLVLSGVDLAVAGPALALPGAAQPFLNLDRLSLSGAGLDLAGRKAAAEVLRLEGGMLRAERRADGGLDLAALAPAGEGGEAAAEPGGPAWDLRLGKVDASGLGAEFRDLAAGPRARLALSSLDMGLENLSLDLERPVPVRLTAGFRPGGRLSLAGSLVPGTPSLRGRLELSGLPLSLVRPWLPRESPVRPERGSFSLAGDLVAAAGPGLAATFAGDAELRGLGLSGRDGGTEASLDLARATGVSLAAPGGRVRAAGVEVEEVNLSDPDGDQPALSLGRLRAEGLDLDPEARTASLRSLVLAAPAAWLEVTPRGLNLSRALQSFRPEESGEAAAGESGEPFILRLDRVRVFGGAVGFRDATVSPAATLRLARLGGQGEDLSTALGESGVRGSLSLNATVERHAPLTLAGSLAPGPEGLGISGRMSLKGLDLAPLNPYLVKFTAYPADTGKLDADLDLTVSGETLSGENRLLVRGLELGPRSETVKDPAVPIQLAMSLLADSSGALSLDIPIHGRLDDPRFDLGKVIASAVAGMVGKLVTAPFAFLGSVFSLVGERSLKGGVVAFAPGSAALDPDAREALSAVARAMDKRPRLEVTAAGAAGPDDGPALKEALFLGKLKARKFRDLKRKRQGPARPDAVEIGPEEYDRWLAEAYEAEPMDKPRNFLGLAREQPREVMERMLRDAVAVGDRELLDLAAERAAAARDFLLAAGVPAERVYVRAPALAGEGGGLVRLGLR